LHTQQYLEKISYIGKRICVLRHPFQSTIPFMWSHHEKLVVIDQTWGFMGGLDLCFGRMDNEHHRLFDQEAENSDGLQEFWPGIDYSNSRVRDFFSVKKYEVTLLDNKRSSPKMPW
jgi:phospholipase D1/2